MITDQKYYEINHPIINYLSLKLIKRLQSVDRLLLVGLNSELTPSPLYKFSFSFVTFCLFFAMHFSH